MLKAAVGPSANLQTRNDGLARFLAGDWDAGRARPLAHSPFVASVNMIADNAAQLIVQTLYIADRDGMRVESRMAREKIDILKSTLDGGLTPALQFWKREFEDLLMEGNALMRARFEGDRLLGIERIAGKYRQWDQGRRLYWGQDREDENYRLLYFSEQEAIVARWGPFEPSDPRFSIAPIQKLRDTILTAQNAERWLSDFFSSNFKTNVIISPSGKAPFSAEDMERLEPLVDGYLRGNRPLLIGRGANVTQVDQKATDQQTIEVLEFLVEETARMFNIPKQLLRVGELKSVGNLYDEYWRSCLSPTIQKMLAPLSLRLLRRGQHFQVDETSGLIRGSLADSTNWINSVRPNTGAMPLYTVNEIRAKNGDPPLTDEQYSEMVKQHREFFESRQPEPQADGDPGVEGDEEPDAEEVDTEDQEG